MGTENVALAVSHRRIYGILQIGNKVGRVTLLQPLKKGGGVKLTSSYTLMGIWLLIHAGIKVKSC